jgi:hypothetical protein
VRCLETSNANPMMCVQMTDMSFQWISPSLLTSQTNFQRRADPLAAPGRCPASPFAAESNGTIHRASTPREHMTFDSGAARR